MSPDASKDLNAIAQVAIQRLYDGRDRASFRDTLHDDKSRSAEV